SIPWDDKLQPGPVGEYLEVIDVDPASNRLYDPVDLNEPKLLAQDGWPPSEGNPQFHQQMVYAVAMTTIGHFEEALGRKALWAPRRDVTTAKDGGERYESYEVPRLRIYPHALRTDNAYYSPDKVALLFGGLAKQFGEGTSRGGPLRDYLGDEIRNLSYATTVEVHARGSILVSAVYEAFLRIVDQRAADLVRIATNGTGVLPEGALH